MTTSSSADLDLSRRLGCRLLTALVLLAGAVYALGLDWGVFEAEPTWAFDEIRPSHLRWRWEILYPPAHRYVLQPIAALARLAAGGTAGGLPVGAAQILASRLVSLAMACGIVMLVYRAARELVGRRASLFAAAALAFGTNQVFYAKTANLDIPYVFWFTLSLFFFLRSLRRQRGSDLMLFALTGALAVATKDQAGGLYLLPGLAIVVTLARGRGQNLFRAVVDRRLVLATLAGAMLYLLLFGFPWRSELAEHIAALKTLPYAHYRTWESSPAGVGQLLLHSIRNLAFTLGVPLLVVSVGGIMVALRQPRQEARLLATLLFAVPYWLIFIASTGFNYDRHYLPINVILALFAARAFAAYPALRRRHLPDRTLLAALLLLYCFLRGLSVDLMLLGDARYAADEWIATNDLGDRTIGLGVRQLLPHGITAVGMGHFSPRRVGEHSYNRDVWHKCRVLDRIDAEYVVHEAPELFTGPGLNYREHRRFHNTARFSILRFDHFPGYYSNIVKAAADSVVFQRTDQECVDLDPTARALHELRVQPDPERRRDLARALFSPDSTAKRIGLGDQRLARALPDNETAGHQPVGLAVRNSGFEPHRPELWIRLEGGQDFPVVVRIEDGNTLREIVFDEPGVEKVWLSEVDPDDYRLFIIWVDRGWRDAAGELRGVRLIFRSAAAERRARAARFSDLLVQLSDSPDDARRHALAEAITSGRSGGETVAIDGGWAAAADDPQRVNADRPTALVVHNDKPNRHRVRLQAVARLPGGTPTRVLVDDGRKTERIQIDDAGNQRLILGELAPGATRLFILRLGPGTDPATALSEGPDLRLRAVTQARIRDAEH